jgi:hypothetical protein
LPAPGSSSAAPTEAVEISFTPVTPNTSRISKQPPSEVAHKQSSSASSTRRVSVSSDLSTQSLVPANIPQAPRPRMMSPRATSGQMNGMNGTNSVFSPPQSPQVGFRAKGRRPSFTSSRAPSGNFSVMKSSSNKRASGNYKIGFVQESAASLRKRSMTELGAGVYQSIGDGTHPR